MMLVQGMSLAKLVRELRFRLGLTQEQFAAVLGTTAATVNRWENGKAQPSPMALRLIELKLHEMGDKGTDLLDRNFGCGDKLKVKS
jgi:putative transcriptional regulator